MAAPLAGQSAVARRTLPASERAPSRARAFVRAVIVSRGMEAEAPAAAVERLAHQASLLVSELVTNAFVHTGTAVDVACTPKEEVAGAGGLTGVLVEVTDRHPDSPVRRPPAPGDDTGFGLTLVHALAASWGVTYRKAGKTVWFRLSDDPEAARPAAEEGLEGTVDRDVRGRDVLRRRRVADGRTTWLDRGGTFLAEVSELLAGQLDEDMVAALAGQLLVPRLVDWCAVWLTDEPRPMRLSRVWHADEQRIAALRGALRHDRPPSDLSTAGTPWPWPEAAGEPGRGGSALAFPLASGGARQGALVVGLVWPREVTSTVVRLVQDVARRVAQAVVTARHYSRQSTISRALQRRQLPFSLARIPGIESAIVYEPHARGQTVGGDFYDVFPMGDERWCFLLGDVQGKDAEAMSVTGLTRHLVRLLAREGHGVESVLSRLNTAMAEEGAEAVAFGGESVQPRFLSLVYGELEPDGRMGGAHCTLASAGHPPPLRLTTYGSVAQVTRPQLLLGIDEDARFTADSFALEPGETLLCVTDGVTERRDGDRQLDDEDGLAELLRGCTGMGAMAVAERVRQATHAFGPNPVEDDLAILALHAVPGSGPAPHPEAGTG